MMARSRIKRQEVATMRVEPRPGHVRRLVLGVFRSLGEATPSVFDVEESVMIDRGQCLGRKYRADRFTAVWLIDVGLIRFYDCRGKMLRTINLFEKLAPQRMAA
jgi:hypothetical protein